MNAVFAVGVFFAGGKIAFSVAVMEIVVYAAGFYFLNILVARGLL